MIAEAGVVAGKAQHGVDAVGIGADDVGLHRQTVAVAADHLIHRRQIDLLEDQTGREAGHAHHGGLIVGDVDRIDVPAQQLGFFLDLARQSPPRRTALAGDGDLAARKNFFQNAIGFHHCKSSLTILRGPPPLSVLQSLASIMSS